MSDEEVRALLRTIANSFISVHRSIQQLDYELRKVREEQRWDKFRRGWFAAMWAVAGAVLAMAVQATTLLREWWVD